MLRQEVDSVGLSSNSFWFLGAALLLYMIDWNELTLLKCASWDRK